MTASAHKCMRANTHTQSRAEFNYFIARFSLLLNLSNFLSFRPALSFLSTEKTSTDTHTYTHTSTHFNHPPVHPLTVGECLEEHVLAVGAVAGHSPGPHLDGIAGPWPQTLQDNVGCFAADH